MIFPVNCFAAIAILLFSKLQWPKEATKVFSVIAVIGLNIEVGSKSVYDHFHFDLTPD